LVVVAAQVGGFHLAGVDVGQGEVAVALALLLDAVDALEVLLVLQLFLGEAERALVRGFH
jgi:hypothetical protein